ncbi:MDR family oxidoreductase [Pseudogemmobacter faecipullorum]|uniref:Oxidoreductase n=1 Tax=Pseudogemmobacter faecipullorum TaxID=2755041 RepID=A0ABS8CLY1_9RHOB|nr:MDR family oxidoreductase [Pseudogemmobacter faecipullorum]MCB5410336.1 oxidoreductase [Pseudogemmobacter faecipullorum]
MTRRFPAMLIRETEGGPRAGLTELSLADLPDHEVLVEISHSSLNYKDGLAITGKARIARRLPMVAGIDLAGVVVSSRAPQWQPGDQVIVNGWGLSETEWGAYSRFQRLKPEFLTRLPAGFSAAEAMAIGTAGYTAALCVLALEDHGTLAGPGPFLVTGAAGGVGTIAIALLAARGLEVTASTGRVSEEGFLRGLGATAVTDRASLAAPGKPLQAELWAGGIDAVGSHTLANALAQTRYGGAIAACGLAGGADLPGTVMPHILRSVALLGVDSVMCPQARRARAWALLERDLDRAKLAGLTHRAKLADLPQLAEQIVAGQIRGRTVIEIG